MTTPAVPLQHNSVPAWFAAGLIAFALYNAIVAIRNLRRISARLHELEPCRCGHVRASHNWRESPRSDAPLNPGCAVSWCSCLRFVDASTVPDDPHDAKRQLRGKK